MKERSSLHKDMPIDTTSAALLERIGVPAPTSLTLDFLENLQTSHLFQIPFENLQMSQRYSSSRRLPVLSAEVASGRRGGICYETGLLLSRLLDSLGSEYQRVLADVTAAGTGPKTHLIFLITLGSQKWLLDIGYGARGPRSPLRLAHGEIHEEPILSSRVDSIGANRWRVSICEHAIDPNGWQSIYTFTDEPASDDDIEKAYAYTVHSPESLLRRHKVISIPTKTGRVSLKNNTLTHISAGETAVHNYTNPRELSHAVEKYFGFSPDIGDFAPRMGTQ